jgi:hypothetical protein
VDGKLSVGITTFSCRRSQCVAIALVLAPCRSLELRAAGTGPGPNLGGGIPIGHAGSGTLPKVSVARHFPPCRLRVTALNGIVHPMGHHNLSSKEIRANVTGISHFYDCCKPVSTIVCTMSASRRGRSPKSRLLPAKLGPALIAYSERHH